MEYQSNITNEEVTALELQNFEGEIVIVEDERSLRRAEELLSGEKILGFDTETRPSFSKKVHYSVSLLQLSGRDFAVLFRLKKCSLPDSIVSILTDKNIVKVGAAIRDDIKILRGVKEFTPAGFIDLQSIIGQWEIKELSVRKMAAIVLGIRVSKAQRLSNWEATKLTSAQIDYAAMDAWVCREIYTTLHR